MASTAIVPPSLAVWLQQLAGILPLTALIDFTDLSVKLHAFELSGAVPFWNWAITPAGARLLLSSQDTTYTCCLDQLSGAASSTALMAAMGTATRVARRRRRACVCRRPQLPSRFRTTART